MFLACARITITLLRTECGTKRALVQVHEAKSRYLASSYDSIWSTYRPGFEPSTDNQNPIPALCFPIACRFARQPSTEIGTWWMHPAGPYWSHHVRLDNTTARQH